MFRQFRKIQRGEFFCVFGDCSQGGADSNFTQFGSKTQRDIPLVLQMHGVAAEATPFIRDALNWIYDQTLVKPVICLERNNGGGSEMLNLIRYNEGKYTIYYMRDAKGHLTDKPGWDTTGGVNGTGTRPKMLGDWLVAYESNQIVIYDEPTQDQHQTFVINSRNKPEATTGSHDDAVMSVAGMWQMMQTEHPPIQRQQRERGERVIGRRTTKKLNLHVGRRG
jgi:hypothetical protein